MDSDKFHWAGKVSRKDIRRLYASDARGLLDEDLLEKIMFSLHARILDMFEVRRAQKTCRVTCRSCGELVPQPFWMGSINRMNVMSCPRCGWQTTCGEFSASYSGKDLLPGSRASLFEEFLQRFETARAPKEKMLLLDWLIHSFHAQSGVSSRLVAMNVIQGSRQQLVELLTSLASGEGTQAARETWLAEENNPIRQFRLKHPSHAKVLDIAAQLGIRGRTNMPENELIAEILRLTADGGAYLPLAIGNQRNTSTSNP